jgi:hypothetical protein
MRTEAWIDQDQAWLADTVRTCGWAIRYIGGGLCDCPGCGGEEDEQPPFAYTVGLHGLDHPELLILGVDPGTAGRVLNEIGDRVRAGTPLLVGRRVTLADWPHRIIPEVVPNPEEILLDANRYYRRPADASVPALQLTYDDSEGRFPWDEGYDSPELQPRPGTFTA